MCVIGIIYVVNIGLLLWLNHKDVPIDQVE